MVIKMYKAIVVDDEKLIRDGISKFINSSNIGIEVPACFADGKDALEYLKDNLVHIVVTDIKMTHVSGVELAKYIFENKPDVRVVIISGYKEFEYAHQAIKYNVKNYLIKPTKAYEIRKILLEIKDELDEVDRLKKHNKQYQELVPYFKEEFISDILLGGLTDENEIRRKIKLLNFDEDLYDRPCLIIEVLLKDEINSKQWKYGRDGFQNFLDNFFIDMNDRVDVFKILFNNHSAKFCMISKQRQSGAEFLKKEQVCFEAVKAQIKQISSMDCYIRVHHFFDSLRQAGSSSSLLSENEIYIEKSKILLAHIMECQKEEAVGILNSIFNSLRNIPIASIKEYMLKLYGVLFENLQKNTNGKISAENPGFDYRLISTFDNKHSIIEYSLKIIDNIINCLTYSEYNTLDSVLAVALRYINENYHKDISLADVASKTYLNPIYFSKFFKKHTGEKFSDYIVRVRMTNAVELLKGGHKIAKVCKLTGYKSSNYFHRVFKSYYGCSPKEYARKIQD